MQQRMKQRIVGAIVLVALAVIFIPMLLQGPVEREATSIPIKIPPKPAVEVSMPSGEQALSTPEPVANAFQPAEPVAPTSAPREQPVAPAPEPPIEASPPVAVEEPAPRPLPKPPPRPAQTPAELGSWAVQVGSFGTEANALRLRNSLRDKGYNSYTERLQRDGKTFYRVRVGPMIDRADAERTQAVLSSTESLKGFVVPHP